MTGLRLGAANAPVSATITASLAGYWPKTGTATITADAVTTIDLTLVERCAGGAVEGRVLDASDRSPIPDANVQTAGVATTTNADGHYRLPGIQVGADNAPRTVQVTASAPGYYSQSLPVQVRCDTTAQLSFGAAPAASFAYDEASGSVVAVSPPGEPGVVDVTVTTAGGTSVPSAGSRFTYLAPDPEPEPCPTQLRRLRADVTVEGGSRLRVALDRHDLPFGLGSIWAGAVEFVGRSASGSVAQRIIAPILTTEVPLSANDDGCVLVTHRGPALDHARFPWTFATLQLSLVPEGSSEATIAVRFGNTSLADGAATGTVNVR